MSAYALVVRVGGLERELLQTFADGLRLGFQNRPFFTPDGKITYFPKGKKNNNEINNHRALCCEQWQGGQGPPTLFSCSAGGLCSWSLA